MKLLFKEMSGDLKFLSLCVWPLSGRVIISTLHRGRVAMSLVNTGVRVGTSWCFRHMVLPPGNRGEGGVMYTLRGGHLSHH